MTKRFLIIFMFAVLNFSVSGQLLYTDLIPDTTISVSLTDSFKYFQVDINQDAVLDFAFVVDHRYEFHSQSCCHFFRSWITSPDSNTKIAVSNSVYNGCTTLALDSGDWIDPGFQYRYLAYLDFEIFMASCPSQPVAPKFYAIKLYLNGNYHYGWLRVQSGKTPGFSAFVKLFDMAINLTPNQPLYAGQITATIFENNLEKELKIFPNPNNGSFTITLKNSNLKLQNSRFQIFNPLGNTVFESTLTDSPFTTYLPNNLENGLYHISIINDEGSFGSNIILDR